MRIFHFSAECYPYAKVGGLGDVVGALPDYQGKKGNEVRVILPKYSNAYFFQNPHEKIAEGVVFLGERRLSYQIFEVSQKKKNYKLNVIGVDYFLDREKVYGYPDDSERFLIFQLAALDWLSQFPKKERPELVHVHDHQAGLLPFLMKHSEKYSSSLSSIPTVLTIHNAQYQGWMNWAMEKYLPHFTQKHKGLLDWDNCINSLASAIKCVWKLTTVSSQYLKELSKKSNGLEKLLQNEHSKSIGILNGIDTEVWNPKKDEYLVEKYGKTNHDKGKKANKEWLCKEYGLSPNKPLFVFIGRLVQEKSAELLSESMQLSIEKLGKKASFIVLGSGESAVEEDLRTAAKRYPKDIVFIEGYHEELSHKLYAGADFLLMPSRIEPCGLNQMYAMRYGTIPIVHSVGGLRDTVIDFRQKKGYGITIDKLTPSDIVESIRRAIELYIQRDNYDKLQKIVMSLDFSWEKSADVYLELYQSLLKT